MGHHNIMGYNSGNYAIYAKPDFSDQDGIV